jgi:hypothetical protein
MPDAMTTGAIDEVISVETQRAREIWKQTRIPVVFRPGGKNSLMVKFPYALDNRDWLRKGHRTKPCWNEHYECWELPRSWFEDVTQRLLRRFGKVYIIQPFRLQEKCAPNCWNAKSLLLRVLMYGRAPRLRRSARQMVRRVGNLRRAMEGAPVRLQAPYAPGLSVRRCLGIDN